jgi:hypothetical protein
MMGGKEEKKMTTTFKRYSTNAHRQAHAYAEALRQFQRDTGGNPEDVVVKTGEAVTEWIGQHEPSASTAPDALVFLEDSSVDCLHVHAVETEFGNLAISYRAEPNVHIENWASYAMAFYADA